MASLNMNFDASAVEPSSVYDPLPNGEYLCCVVASDMKYTRDNTGQYLELELEVMDGNFKGRKVWDRLNLINHNAKAVEIAQRQLSSICHAAGVLHVTDSNQLHNIPVIATVKYREPNGPYNASNDVRGYKAASQSATTAQPATSPAAPPVHQSFASTTQQTATTGVVPPWGRRT
ncbi:MAG: hypothetical protein CR991_10305 [Proteobacteria bacterium]|nr:MAG: hypothetical protein CR991_10305 [Pseudomonadota bacterium]